ncbi:MAG TPA: AI-2E family transporter [Firmicutes bacterium]|nr:AI-2E family transporter [Bacillota bacterium]HHT42371.1 AI-2E family transporter [Bacillota bacterium]
MSKRTWWALLFVGILAFLYRVRTVLTPFLFAILFAYVLYPLIAAVEKRGASRVAAILLVYVLFGVVLGVVGWATLPSLLKELEEIARRIPRQAVQLEELGQDAVGFFRHLELPGTLRDAVDTLMERVQLALEGLASKLMQVLMDVFTNMVSLIISPILAFYLLRDHQAMRERALRYVPAQYRGDAQYILREINTALNGFFRGQLWICLFVGLFIYVGLVLLKIPYALFIGLLAGLFDIIPYFGPVLGFLPAAALAVARSPLTVLWVLLLFTAANQIENGLISPWLIGDRVGLHPLAVVFAVLVGGHLMGLIGMLMAIPAAAILRVFLDYFLLRRRQPE